MITFSVLYRYNENKRLKKDGTAPVNVLAYEKGGKRKYFFTGISVKPNQWHDTRWVIKHPQSKAFNSTLRKQLNEMEAFISLRQEKGLPINLYILGNYSNAQTDLSFTDFFKQQIEDASVNKNTKASHLLTLSYLKEIQPTIYFNELKLSLLHRFNKLLAKDKDLAVNTIAKHHKHLRTYIGRAIDFEYLDINKNPYRTFKIKREHTEKIFLRISELEKLKALSFSEEQSGLAISRDFYLFAAWTGLRLGDLKVMTAHNFIDTPDGLTYQKRSNKTKKPYISHLRKLFGGKPEQLIKSYLKDYNDYYFDDPYKPKTIFFDRAGQTINKDLKILARMAKIDPYKESRITVHTARHSFATNMVALGIKITTVQMIMQHSKLSTTMPYQHLDNQMINEELDRINGKE